MGRVMSARVVHCKREAYDVYVGRPSKWGNPFSNKSGTLASFQVLTVEDAVDAYEQWIMTQPELVTAAKQELKGKTLGCWCSPRPCHGDVLLRIANDDDDWRDCIITFEMTKARLEAIEAKLAERFGLTGDVRAQLIVMDKTNELEEDDLVADWHCELASYYDWIENP